MSYKTLPMDDNTPQIELPYNYLIWKSGSDYIIKNTTTGVKTTGTVFATLLNSAIASATAGDSFFFRPGAYTILAEIDSSVGLNFYGSGIDNTIIRCGAGYAASNHILHFATTVATTPCHIDGITFDGDQGTGQTSAAQGLWIEGMDLTIENCKVMDAYNTGILVFVDDLAVSTVKIVNNTIINAGLGGGAGYGPSIRVDHRAGSTQTIKNVYISGNHCSSGGEHGIKVYDSTADNAEIIGNTILSTAKAGIWCQAGGSVANNVVREAGGNGIVIGDTGVGAAVNCHGNYVYSCGGVESAYRGGIYINNSSPYSTFIGNHIYDSFEHGIQTSSDYCTFVGNTIITAGGYGVVVVSGGDNNVFMDNIINTINKVSDSGSDNRWQNNTGYITETQTSPYKYTVYKSGSTYYAINPSTGNNDYSGTVFVTFINTVIAACAAGDRIHVKSGTYVGADTAITWKSGVSMSGDTSGTIFDFSASAAGTNIIEAFGTLGTAYNLSANAAAFDDHLHVDAHTAYANNDMIFIYSAAVWQGNIFNALQGEIQFVDADDGTTVNLRKARTEPGYAVLIDAYTTANTGRVVKITPMKDIVIEGIKFLGSAAIQSIYVKYGLNFIVKNCIFEKVRREAVQYQSCVFSHVDDCYFLNCNEAGEGYGVAVAQACQNVVVSRCQFNNCRHGFSGGAAAAIGIPRNILVTGCAATDCTSDAFNFHAVGENVIFDSNTVTGGLYGFGNYAFTGAITNNVINCAYIGIEEDCTLGTGLVIANNVMRGCYEGFVANTGNSRKTIFSNNYITGATVGVEQNNNTGGSKFKGNYISATTHYAFSGSTLMVGDYDYNGGSEVDLLNNGTAEYFPVNSVKTKTTTETAHTIVITHACTVIKLGVYLSAAPATTDSYTISLRKNGGTVTPAVTVTGAATSGFWYGSYALAVGDLICMISNGGVSTPTASTARVTLTVVDDS